MGDVGGGKGRTDIPIVDWPEVKSADQVKSGERGLLRLPVDLGSEGEVTLSQFVLQGAADGPTFFLLAGQHGVELNGCAAVETFINKVDLAQLRGRILAVPVANPVSIAKGEQRIRFADASAGNMNRIWPGNLNGTFIERLARVIWNHGLSTCQWCLDIHCWGQAPAALFPGESAELIAFGKATGLTFLHIRDTSPEQGYTRTAANVAHYEGKAIGCAVELTGQYLIHPDQVSLGCRLLENLLRHAGMLPGEPSIPRQINMPGAQVVEVRSPSDASFQPGVSPGDSVFEGQPIIRLYRFDAGRPEWLTSPVEGAIGFVGALDQMKKSGRYDRAMTSAVRAGERVATIYQWQD